MTLKRFSSQNKNRKREKIKTWFKAPSTPTVMSLTCWEGMVKEEEVPRATTGRGHILNHQLPEGWMVWCRALLGASLSGSCRISTSHLRTMGGHSHEKHNRNTTTTFILRGTLRTSSVGPQNPIIFILTFIPHTQTEHLWHKERMKLYGEWSLQCDTTLNYILYLNLTIFSNKE